MFDKKISLFQGFAVPFWISMCQTPVYKDNGKLSAGDEFQVQESCAIYDQDGEYYYETMDDIQPLKKGAEYILYLDSGADNMSGKPAIMSENNCNLKI